MFLRHPVLLQSIFVVFVLVYGTRTVNGQRTKGEEIAVSISLFAATPALPDKRAWPGVYCPIATTCIIGLLNLLATYFFFQILAHPVFKM